MGKNSEQVLPLEWGAGRCSEGQSGGQEEGLMKILRVGGSRDSCSARGMSDLETQRGREPKEQGPPVSRDTGEKAFETG